MSIKELNNSIIANDLTLAESLIESMDTVEPKIITFHPFTCKFAVTPLFLAAKHKHLSLVKRLLEKGADINFNSVCEESNTVVSPLHGAIMAGDLEITKYLREKGVIYDPGVLSVAAQHGHLHIVKYFVERGLHIENRCRKMEYTPLQWACANGNLELCEYLLDKGANVELDEKHLYYLGRIDLTMIDYPLHLACIRGNLEIVKLLVQRGANVNSENVSNKENKSGLRTPLSIAVANGKMDLIDYLLDKGAEVNKSNLDLVASICGERLYRQNKKNLQTS